MKVSQGRRHLGQAREGTERGISRCLLVASWTASLTGNDMTVFSEQR